MRRDLGASSDHHLFTDPETTVRVALDVVRSLMVLYQALRALRDLYVRFGSDKNW